MKILALSVLRLLWLTAIRRHEIRAVRIVGVAGRLSSDQRPNRWRWLGAIMAALVLMMSSVVLWAVPPALADTPGTWTATGFMGTARGGYAATLLPNGKVLIAGGKAPST